MRTRQQSELQTGIATASAQAKPQTSSLRLALPGLVLALVSLLPFLNKAFTIDDPWFLMEARQILKTPLQPMSFPVCWLGPEICVARAGSFSLGPAQSLMGYILVPTILAGGAEWVAHLTQLLFACLAIVEMVRLALRLGFDRTQATMAGLILVAMPPFLSMTSTAMPDLPALALGLLGIERLLAWKDEPCWQHATLAILGLGIAPYARPHLILLLPLGALWLLDDFRFRNAAAQFRRQSYLWSPILIATCLLIALNMLTRDPGPPAEGRNVLLGHQYRWNVFSYLMYLSFPIPFAAVWIGARWRRMPLLGLLPAIAVLVYRFLIVRTGGVSDTLVKLAVAYGAMALLHMMYTYYRRRDRLGILLSLWVLIPAPVVVYNHFPIKYLLIITPAVVLIILHTLSAIPRSHALKASLALVIAMTAYSWVLLTADADFAEYGRRATAELIAPHVAAGEKVWFTGQWGFQWYAEKAGARIIKPDEPGPAAGDLWAFGIMEQGIGTLKRFANRDLVDSRSYNSPHGRTLGGGAGFYSNGLGVWPWVWAPETVNTYQLWRIL